MLSEVHVVLNGDIFCRDLNIDGLAIDFIFCVDVWFPLVPLLPMVPKIVLDLQIRIQQWISAEISEGLFANS